MAWHLARSASVRAMRLPAGRHRQLGDQAEIDLYQKMLHEPDAAKQRVLMREFEKRVVVTEAHEFPMLWWYRTIPYRSYVKGWKKVVPIS
jgi:hypothetical protein